MIILRFLEHISLMSKNTVFKQNPKFRHINITLYVAIIAFSLFQTASASAQSGKDTPLTQALKTVPQSAIATNNPIIATVYNLDVAQQAGLIGSNNDITPLLSRLVSPNHPVLAAFASSHTNPEWIKATGIDLKSLKSFIFYHGHSKTPVTVWHMASKSNADNFYMGLLSRGFSRVIIDGTLSNEQSLRKATQAKNNQPVEGNPFMDQSGSPTFIKKIKTQLLQSQDINDLTTIATSLDNDNLVSGNADISLLTKGIELGGHLLEPDIYIIQSMIVSEQFGQGLNKMSEMALYGPGGETDKRLPFYSVAALSDIQRKNGDRGILLTLLYKDCTQVKIAERSLKLRFADIPDIKTNPLLNQLMIRARTTSQNNSCIVNFSALTKTPEAHTTSENILYTLVAFGILTNNLPLLTADKK